MKEIEIAIVTHEPRQTLTAQIREHIDALNRGVTCACSGCTRVATRLVRHGTRGLKPTCSACLPHQQGRSIAGAMRFHRARTS
jgi:hypothetical protein